MPAWERVLGFDPEPMLKGELDSEKMLDWGVGQVFKRYGKGHDPKAIKDALRALLPGKWSLWLCITV